METRLRSVRAHCGAVLALLAGAVAQANSEDDIARCARIPSAGDRIVCLEDALRRAQERQDSVPTGMRAGEKASASGADGVDEAAKPATEESANAAAPAREAGEFGLDEPRVETGSPESIRVTVIAIGKNAYGKPLYSTEDGQVWQQIDQRTPRYPDAPFSAEIRTAAAGSYFLQPLSSGVAVRVQRKR